MLELFFGERPTPLTLDARGDPTFGSRHPRFVEHEHHVRVFPLHASDRAGVALKDPLTHLAELLGDHKCAIQPAQRFREFGRSEVGGGEDGDLWMGAADVDGAAGGAAVGADGNRAIPREPGAGESQRDRGESRQDTQVLPPKPVAEKAHDAEETGVSRSEHHHGTFGTLDPRERLRKVALQRHGTVAVKADHVEVPSAADDERRVPEQTFDLLVERPSIEANHGYTAPAHAEPHAVSASAPGLAPAGSRVLKSTRMT